MLPIDLFSANNEGKALAVIRQSTSVPAGTGTVNLINFQYVKTEAGWIYGIYFQEVSGDAIGCNVNVLKNGVSVINAYNGNFWQLPLKYFEDRILLLNIPLQRQDVITVTAQRYTNNKLVMTELFIIEKGTI